MSNKPNSDNFYDPEESKTALKDGQRADSFWLRVLTFIDKAIVKLGTIYLIGAGVDIATIVSNLLCM